MKTPDKESADDGDDSTEESYSDDSQIIPEELQQEAITLVDKCNTMACVDYISSLLSEKRSEIYKKEEAKKNPKGKKVPNEYSTADYPK